MALKPLGDTGILVSALGLGCSRLASVSTGVTRQHATALLEAAYGGGIRFFDTADIYGQGDSERRIAHIANRDGAIVCTKAGLELSVNPGLIRFVKPVVAPLLRRLRGAQKATVSLRRQSEGSNFDPSRLRPRLEASVKRLKRARADVFLLHGPSLDELADGSLYAMLDAARADGLARACGISCRGLDDATAIIAEGRAQVIQVPLSVDTLPRADAMLTAAHDAGIGVIAREVFAGKMIDKHGLEGALSPLLEDPRISTALTGTTSLDHLAANMAVFQNHTAPEPA